MTWVWDQIDNTWLREPVGIGHYFLGAPQLAKVEVDGQSVGSVWIEVEEGELNGVVRHLGFKIIHPVYEGIRERDIDFTGKKKKTNDTIKIQLLSIDRSEKQQTLVIKPVGANPVMRIRILGPLSKESPPPLRAVHEFRETFSITFPPDISWVTIMEFVWDFRDQTTGELVPNGFYVAIIEICGLVEVNGETVGMIANPLNIGAISFRKE